MPVPVLEKVGNIVNPNPAIVAETVAGPGPFDRPGPDNDGIHEIRSEEIPQIAQSLSEAFEDDPHFSFMLRDETKKLLRLGHGILNFIKHDWLPNGIVHANEQLSGAAIWTEPGKWQANMLTQLRIMKSLTGVVSPAEVPRLLHVLSFAEDKHKEIEDARGPHWYLAMLGVTPEWQGKGWGDELLRPVLEHCDESGEAAYLESSTPQSVPLYERNGFEVIAKGHYRGATEDLHFMWRNPQ